MQTGRKKITGGLVVLIFVNIMLIMWIVGNLTMSRFSSVISKYGADWPEVEVTIDDVSFEYSHSETDDGDKTYYYDMHRILHFTYDGVDYEVQDTEEYSSSKADYKVELRTGYTDKYTYQINPENPASFSKSYSIFEDDNAYENFNKLITVIPLAVLVVIDVIALITHFRKKRNIFDEA